MVNTSLVTTTTDSSRHEGPAQGGDQLGLARAHRAADAHAQRAARLPPAHGVADLVVVVVVVMMGMSGHAVLRDRGRVRWRRGGRPSVRARRRRHRATGPVRAGRSARGPVAAAHAAAATSPAGPARRTVSAATAKGSRPSSRTAAWAGVVTAWCTLEVRDHGGVEAGGDGHPAERHRQVGAGGAAATCARPARAPASTARPPVRAGDPAGATRPAVPAPAMRASASASSAARPHGQAGRRAARPWPRPARRR